MSQFDLNKSFLHMEDNGDGTVTNTIHIPELGHGQYIVAVLPGSLLDLVEGMVADFSTASDIPKTLLEASQSVTIIPNNADDIEQ